VRQDGGLSALDRFPETRSRQLLRTLRLLGDDDHALQNWKHQLKQLQEDGGPRAPLDATEPGKELVLVRLQGDVHPRIGCSHLLHSTR
jgi:hypothetical protein